jgi:hypothetical protein
VYLLLKWRFTLDKDEAIEYHDILGGECLTTNALLAEKPLLNIYCLGLLANEVEI